MTFAWLEHLFGVGHVGQEVNIPKVIAVVLLVVTFYRMGMVSYLNFFISVVTMPVPLEKRITEVERHL